MLRPIVVQAGWGWVRDSSRFVRRLRSAADLGYNAVVWQFDSPSPRSGDKANWYRNAKTGWVWKLGDGKEPGTADAKGWLIGAVRRASGAAAEAGLEFIPNTMAFGWGGTLPVIDASTLAGIYYELDVPSGPENLFGDSAVKASDPWGDAGGKAVHAKGAAGPDPARFRLSLPRKGLYAANLAFKAPWDGWISWRMRVRATAAGDAACLKAYEFNGWEYHPYSSRPAGSACADLGKDTASVEASFFVRKRHAYFLNVEYHARGRKGGILEAVGGSLSRAVPPRAELVDMGAYERAPDPKGPSPRSYLASKGLASEAAARTLISARSPILRDTDFFALPQARADSAWASMAAFRGTFRDRSPEAFRDAVDPLAPSTRQILDATLDALFEALGAPPRLFHLGGDEVFSLGRSRRQILPPYRDMSPAALYAALVKNRMAQVADASSRAFPGRPAPDFLLYGDMLTEMNGAPEGTLEARRMLSPDSIRPWRLTVMPWYYETHLSGLTYLRKAGRGSAQAALRDILRKDAEGLSAAGLDFIGIYCSDGAKPGLKDAQKGAEEWIRICREFTVPGAGKGRCAGLGYSGWDNPPSADWGRNYNGLFMLAKSWEKSAPRARLPARWADLDHDGVLDELVKRTRD
jgi:hypothetical protein